MIVRDNRRPCQVPYLRDERRYRQVAGGTAVGHRGGVSGRPREIISAAALARRVAELGAEIDRNLPAGPLTVVGVLRGAFMFMADLVRAIPRDLTCDFLGVRSYGDATVSSGVVQITSDLAAPIDGRHVLLVEDIADTGLTLRYLHDLLQARSPTTIHICTLLAKASYKQNGGPRLDFVGFEAPDGYVVGYGLDAGQLHRNLPGICILEPVSI